jgi:hypothetical protein
VTDADLLKLAARDAADLEIVSSMLQDALVPLSDIAWLRDERRFVMAFNRFRWERAGKRSVPDERVAAGISFEGIERVQRRGVEAAGRGGFLSLLSVALADDAGEGRVAVVLTFAGGAAIRLESASLLCHLEDFGEPWPTQWRPEHT